MPIDVLERLPQGARVAVIRLRSLGDCVLATPSLRLLKAYRPDLKVGVVVEKAFAPVFAGNPDVDTILEPGLMPMARFRPKLALNLHGGPRSARLALASGAGLRAGFAHFRMQWCYNLRIPTAQEILGVTRTVHTAEHAAAAMFWLGVPAGDIPAARLYAQGSGRHGAYAVIHPKASAEAKTWPAARFSAIGRFLEDELGLKAVFIAGPGENLDEFGGFERMPGAPLEEVKRLMSGAALFVGNDSGPAHMAAAFGVPCVVLFGPSEPVIWHPWRTPGTVLRAAAMEEIGVDEVREAARGLRTRSLAAAGKAGE